MLLGKAPAQLSTEQWMRHLRQPVGLVMLAAMASCLILHLLGCCLYLHSLQCPNCLGHEAPNFIT